MAQLVKLQERPRAKAAVCTQRFHISEAQQSAVLVPAGTRVTCSGGLVRETAEDVYINIGDTYAVLHSIETASGNPLSLCQTHAGI